MPAGSANSDAAANNFADSELVLKRPRLPL